MLRNLENSHFLTSLTKLGQTLSSLAIFFGVLGWIVDAPERQQQRINQAWILINNSYQRPGDNGRGGALTDLIRHDVSLEFLNLAGATLINANMRGASLRDARFDESHLRQVRFDPRLPKLNLYLLSVPLPTQARVRTILSRASFRAADLFSVRFDHAHLTNVDLCVDVAAESSFAEALISTVKFCGVLKSIRFDSASLYNVRFKGTKLDGISFRDASLKGVDFTEAEIGETNLEEHVLLSNPDVGTIDFSKIKVAGPTDRNEYAQRLKSALREARQCENVRLPDGSQLNECPR